MSKEYPNQRSFSSGELSPLMGGRSDLETYASGLKTLRNMYSDPRGPAVTREGMKLIQASTIGEANSRVEVFNRTSSQFSVFVMQEAKLRYIQDIDFPTSVDFVAPWTVDQIDEYQIVPLPDGRTFYFLHPNIAPYKLVDQVGAQASQEFLSSGNFTVPIGVTELFVCVAGGGGGGGRGIWYGGGGGGGGSGVTKSTVAVVPAQVLPVTVGAGGAGGTGAGSIDNGANGGNSTFDAITVNGGSGGLSGLAGIPSSAPSAGGPGSNGGGGGGFGNAPSDAATPGAACSNVCGGSNNSGGDADTDIISIYYRGGGGGGGGFGRGGNGGGTTVGYVPISTGDPGGISAGGGGGGSDGISSDAGGDGGGGKVLVQWVTPAAGLTFAAIALTGIPADWAGTNWPSCGTYYENRLWLASDPANGERFIASKPTDPEDFSIGTGLDGDGLSFFLQNFGQIEWMASTKELLLGTANGEYVITSVAGAITPSDISVDQQSSYGSASIQPVKIGDQVIYVSPDKRKIRAINYEDDKKNWMSVDLSFPSEHLTRGKIKSLAWAQHPDNLLWVLLEDGTMACMSYERGNNVQGWHRHDTNGKIKSIAVGFDGSNSLLVSLTDRELSGGVGGKWIYLEVMSGGAILDLWQEETTFYDWNNANGNDFIFILGAGYSFLVGIPITVILKSLTSGDFIFLSAIVGDPSEPGLTDQNPAKLYLNTGGILASEFTTVYVGLAFIQEVETLDLDGGSAGGSGASHKKRRNKLKVRVKNSGVPTLNGKIIEDRTPVTGAGYFVPVESSSVIEVVDDDWSEEATVNIKQDLPLLLTVLSIYGEVKKNAL